MTENNMRSIEAAKKVNILLVDDEPEFLEILCKHLRKLGLHIQTADCCYAAVATMEEGEQQVLVMDISMPEVDGITCLKEVKSQWPMCEVIILTGHASIKSGVEGMRNGAFDYCLKPIDTQELVEKIELAARKALLNTP